MDGLVPCFTWACVRLKSAHSDWILPHTDLVVNGRCVSSLRTSWILTDLTTESSVQDIKQQIWQFGSMHKGAFLLAKSDRMFARPERWLTLTWYLLTTERKVVTLVLDENSSRHNFSKPCTHGLLSVKSFACSCDCIIKGLKCLTRQSKVLLFRTVATILGVSEG